MMAGLLRPFLLVLFWSLAGASPTAAAQGAAGEAPPGGARSAPAQASARHATPAEAVHAFLAGMRAYEASGFKDTGALEQALSAFPPDRRKAPGAEELATRLYAVLLRTWNADLEPWRGRGMSALGRDAWHGFAPGTDIGFTLRLRDSGEGGWTIDESTLEEVPLAYRRLEGRPVVAEALAELPLLERWRWRLRNHLPGALLARTFLLENWQWLALGLLVFLGVLADRLVRFLVARAARRLERSERVRLDPDQLANFERPFGLFVVAAVFVGALPLAGLAPSQHRVLSLAGSVVLVLGGVWAAYRLVDVLAAFLEARAKQTRNKFDDMLVPLLRRTLKILLTIVGIVYIASQTSEDVYGLVAGLSIGSLAVGFAARDSIENLFGTFTVLLDKPFQLGDWIISGDIEGTVEEVGFRSTRIRTFYNSLVSVPNRTFISATVDNMGARRFRRIKTMLSLTYDTPPEKIDAFCEGVRELIRTLPDTRKDSFHVYLNAFSASSIDILLYCFVRTPDWGSELAAKHDLFAHILRLADRLGVCFAFPTQTVHLAKPEDALHPDRPPDRDAARALGRRVARELAGGATAD